MYLQTLQLSHFKNHEEANLVFSPHINAFVGNNGMGKTNLLDAVYYLSFCKSYFSVNDQQNIQIGEDFFAIHGNYCFEKEEEDLISCIQRKGNKKEMRRNKKEYERLSDHIGRIPLVMISPFDQQLIHEGSEIRRAFLDKIISQYDKIYLEHLIQYLHWLAQRNKLLKSDVIDDNLLAVLNERLSETARPIHEKRTECMHRFLPLFRSYYNEIAGDKEEVAILYQSHLYEEEDLNLLLQKNMEKDRILQYTSVGIHKDELQFLLNGKPLKKFGSQGQQKSFVLAMRLAELEMLAQRKGLYPILLLDDIFDKLDKERVARLIELVNRHHFGQVFLTDTDFERVENIFKTYTNEHKIFQIQNGIISLSNG